MSFPRSTKIDIYTNIATSSELKIYLSAGRQGYSFISKAATDTDGQGGGGGIASYLYTSDENTFIDFLGNSGNTFSKFNKNNTSKKEALKGIIFEGGLAGLIRITDPHEQTYFKTIWSFPYTMHNQDDVVYSSIRTHFFQSYRPSYGKIPVSYQFAESFTNDIDVEKRFSNHYYTHVNDSLAWSKTRTYVINSEAKGLFYDCLHSNRLILSNDCQASELSDTETNVDILKNKCVIKGNSYYSYETGILGLMSIGNFTNSQRHSIGQKVMSYKSFVSGTEYESVFNESSDDNLY